MLKNHDKHWKEAMGYAEGVRDGTIVANNYQRKAVERFFRDMDDPRYEMKPDDADFCLNVIESTLCHAQGEAIDGTPMRGTPFLLMPFDKFIVYNLVGFKLKGTDILRFHEAMIFLPRKNSKTSFVAGLAWSLSLLFRKSGSKCYIASSALIQSLEAFNFLTYNIKNMGEWDKEGGCVHINDNHNEHSFTANLPDGSIFVKALAASVDKQDSLNANLCICDELHSYTTPKQYNLFKQCQKAYTNKLLIGISSAGDNEQGFLGQRLKYCKNVLDGMVEDEQYFIFLCEADPDENGDIDYTNPIVHQMANPGYGVTIRPNEILNDALQAQNSPQERKDFLSKSLNVFTTAMKAWFNVDEFRASDKKYTWTLEELARLPVRWYGGADLSRMYDLTAAALYGRYEGVDIIITHAFFPITQAAKKADEDGIPLYGWQDDGWLTMCNSPTVNVSDVVNWFLSMKAMGFRIVQVGHDRKFAGEEYFPAMRKAGFRIKDIPQYFYLKSQGFRHIEKSAKDGTLYYLHSEAYEYCVSNVRAVEKTDDAVQYEKIQPQHRIDLFDASVFACVCCFDGEEVQKKVGGFFGK